MPRSPSSGRTMDDYNPTTGMTINVIQNTGQRTNDNWQINPDNVYTGSNLIEQEKWRAHHYHQNRNRHHENDRAVATGRQLEELWNQQFGQQTIPISLAAATN